MTYRHIPAEIIKKRGVSVKKRILSILLAVLMLLSALPLGMVDTAYAAALASGKCGDSHLDAGQHRHPDHQRHRRHV